ncbi:peptidase M24, structural domain-containing protein [Irpex rosettiformis]|uniref:Peptidase M24, structural domain-containing protein n=1 Tax=Irpex rosettiformis TaxID=378272 RepID=A0ACB8UDY5_9APHY|nr:peptidase M24, structural domain-containing protein [Irpex rosettiformis]
MLFRSFASTRTFAAARLHLQALQPRSDATEVGLHHDLKPTRFGQPLFASHPHLINSGEVTPGITAYEYERRRRALMDRLPADSLVVSVSGQTKYMSGRRSYKFRQASDFWYLTGFEEPDSAVILEKTSCSRGYRMIIFSRGKDSHAEKWEGARTSTEDIVKHFKADDAQPITQFPPLLKSLTSSFSNVYLDIPPSASMSRRGRHLSQKALLKFLTPGANSARMEYDAIIESLSASKLKPLAPEVAQLRATKSDAEQHIMRFAAAISGHAHAKTMRFTQPGKSEHALASHFEYICAINGAQRPAYVPVVASGPNALVIHYTSNNQVVQDGELVLIDAGCEYNGYASDITRTYPANGKFTPAQGALYNAVLQAQKYLVTLCTEGAHISLAEIHRESLEALRKELDKIGFNLHGIAGAGDLERILYPHYVGHPLGIDLHESTHFDRCQPLKAGMVITIEPGKCVYVPPSPLFPKEFHDIGIRIEDDVLIGKDHPIILSVSAPKEIADVEGACQGLLGLEAF